MEQENTKYVGVIYESGKVGAFAYSGPRVGVVNRDLGNDPSIADFMPGFGDEAGALAWAENNVR